MKGRPVLLALHRCISFEIIQKFYSYFLLIIKKMRTGLLINHVPFFSFINNSLISLLIYFAFFFFTSFFTMAIDPNEGCIFVSGMGTFRLPIKVNLILLRIHNHWRIAIVPDMIWSAFFIQHEIPVNPCFKMIVQVANDVSAIPLSGMPFSCLTASGCN